MNQNSKHQIIRHNPKIQMIFYHKPYYNLNYTNPNKKKVLMIHALNLKNYTKYTNRAKQKNLKKHTK
jgi:hypothetical protein